MVTNLFWQYAGIFTAGFGSVLRARAEVDDKFTAGEEIHFKL